MGKNWTIGNNEGNDAYFPYFRAMEKKKNLPFGLYSLSTTLNIDEEERNDVYIYKTLRYPPKTTPPTID